MRKTISIGSQDFGILRTRDNFYVDKTDFIREWWESEDEVTLITRPRRFGKTLNMSMVEHFFSVQYPGRADLFQGLSIWEREEYRKLQGTYPVISFSLARVKERDYQGAIRKIFQILSELYGKHRFLLKGNLLSDEEKSYFQSVSDHMDEITATESIHRLSDYLSRCYGKKVLILLDEYDTPMQEAYVYGYWDEMSGFMRSLFHSSFKTNPYLERALMTGITRVSKESIFSDFNNPKVVTTTSEEYADCFGFTEEEVFAALDEYGLSEKKKEVKLWYDGFTFGNKGDIYNPWSIINYLKSGKVGTYWANTSSNSLAGKLIREGDEAVKLDFEQLLRGETLKVTLEEQVVYDELSSRRGAVWSLLLACGYLKVLSVGEYTVRGAEIIEPEYELDLTNIEVRIMFRHMVHAWFHQAEGAYNQFLQALLLGDVKAMNRYMNHVALETFSYFDTGSGPSRAEPERFYHGFVLGLMVDLDSEYTITSNRESGFGRYDVMLEPKNKQHKGILLEFKVRDPEDEADLTETAEAALAQIEEKQYAAALQAKGVPKENIRCYGFAFEGKTVLIKGS